MPFFISFLAGVLLFYLFLYFPFSTVSAGLIFSSYLVFRKKFLLIPVLIFGAAYAFLRYEPAQDIPYIRDKVYAAGTFETYPEKTEAGTFKQTFIVASAADSENGKRLDSLTGREITLFSGRGLDPEREYELVIKFLKSGKRLNPGESSADNISAYLAGVSGSKNRGKSLHLRIEECRHRINDYIEENFGRDSGAFISAITTGRTERITGELREAFNAAGLTHILSISGSHFGLFSVILFGVFRLLMNALPYRVLQRLTIFLTPSQASALLCLPFMIAYLALSGARVPAVRSFIMISLFLAGLLIGRKGFWLNSLLFAAVAVIIWEPGYILSLSFQLSFLAVLCIGFSLRKYDDTKEGGGTEKSRLPAFAVNSLLITLAATIGTAPLVAYYFHYLSVISPLSNLLIGPLVGLALIPLSVFSSLLFLASGHFITTPVVSAVSEASLALIGWFSKIPFADVKIPAFPPAIILLFYAGFVFYFIFNRRKYLLFIPFMPVVIYLVLAVLEKKELSVTFLDVGQGDSSVIELPDGRIMVADTGRTGRETASFLRYMGKENVDFVALSHGHPDHTGGLDTILSKFHVGEIWYGRSMTLPDGPARRSLSRGDTVEGQGYRIYVLHPYPGFYTSYGNEYVAENNDSLVFRIEGGHGSVLFAGDVEEEAEKDLLHLGKWLKSDVIKVPHHGGKTSACRPFLEEVSAGIAIISAGRDNSFGHPHREMLDALGRERIIRTDTDGAVKISESRTGPDIKTWTDFQFERAGSLRDEMRNFRLLFEKW